MHATIDNIGFVETLRVNEVHPFVLYCSYQDTCLESTFHFKSNPFWEEPWTVLKPGAYVDVYVHHSNYSQYYVDVEEALKRTG